MEALDLCRQHGFLHTRAVQQFIYGSVHLSDLHDIDTVLGGWRDRYKLPANIGAGPVEFMALQRSNNKDLDTLTPHTCCHQLHTKTLAGAAGAKNGNIGILVDPAVKDVHDDQGVVVFVDSKQDAVVIPHFIAGKGIPACRTQRQHIALGSLIQPPL